MFQHTATRRWLLTFYIVERLFRHRFNTQPPEGGCISGVKGCTVRIKFQHTATRRWLLGLVRLDLAPIKVSTHSHPKVAAEMNKALYGQQQVSTHSHPKVAAYDCQEKRRGYESFNTQPPEGGCKLNEFQDWLMSGFNTQPPEGGCTYRC